MNFVVFIIVLIVLSLVLMGVTAKLMQGKVDETSPIMVIPVLVIIALAIYVGVSTHRMYIIEEVDGELTSSTKVVFFNYTYVTEDGDEIEIEPYAFGCSILNLTNKELLLYPIYYAESSVDLSDQDDKTYFIYPYSFEATDEWNVDYLPPDQAPEEVETESSIVTYYVLEES